MLGGYTSAVFLAGIAGLMLYQSVERLASPTPIHYDQAIAIAVVGLLVNIACAWLLNSMAAIAMKTLRIFMMAPMENMV